MHGKPQTITEQIVTTQTLSGSLLFKSVFNSDHYSQGLTLVMD